MRNRSPRSKARRAIKQEISKLKALKRNLPRLIDCSRAYRDNHYTDADYAIIDKSIAEAEERLRQFDIDNPISQHEQISHK